MCERLCTSSGKRFHTLSKAEINRALVKSRVTGEHVITQSHNKY